MKRGDLVKCRTSFKVEIIEEDSIMTISINTREKDHEVKDYILIPLYLGHFNLNFPKYDRCLPGCYLPIEHPDYYRESESGTFLYNGEEYRVNFDPEFMYTGKYYLMSSARTILKTAQLRSKELLQHALSNMIGATFDGSLIQGIVLDFIIRDRYTNELHSIVNVSKPFSSSRATKVFAFIQDPVTKVEFEFPTKYLINKWG